jgi:amino acid adenylation domain-containing protein
MSIRQQYAAYSRKRHGIHNLGRPEVIADPRVYIDAIAELGPLFYDEVGSVWVCSGYAETAQILGDHRRFSSARSHNSDQLNKRGLGTVASITDMIYEQMLFVDPPKHTEIRGLIREQFTNSRVRSRDDAMKAIVDRILTELPRGGTVDLVADFAGRLPSALVAHLLGMEGREERLTRWADAYERLLGSLSTLPHVRDQEVKTVLAEAMSGFREEALKRLISPGDDIISSMVSGFRDGPPTEEELFSIAANCIVLVGGGYQTLTHLVTTGLLLLHDHPEQLRKLRENPEIIDSAIDEFMRLNGSSQYIARQATEDVELNGMTVSAGQTVILHLAAANLDPRTYPDPHSLDITRRGAKHLGFGMGRHYCTGAPYAERMARWAISGFLARYSTYAPEQTPDAIVWGHHANTRCLERALFRVASHEEHRVDVPADPGERTQREIETSITHDTEDTDERRNDVLGAGPLDVEHHRQLVDWNDTATPLLGTPCWHQVFEQRAHLAPDTVAVDDQDTRLTYRELDQRANAMAAVLRGHGVQPGSVVGVVMERSVEFVVAVLAIAKAGGAFLLADVSCPAERLHAMIAEASVSLVVTSPGDATRLDLPVPFLTVDPQAGAARPPISGVSAGDPAYVVFTSGTTGRPKAIVINHEAVVNLHQGQRQIFRLGDGDRVLQFLSPNFDGCFADICLALLCGATLVVSTTARLTVGPPLLRFLQEQRITVAILTVSVWSALPEGPLPDLRIAAAAGERLPAAWVTRWSAPGRRLLNLYGPAETAVMATWHECATGDVTPPIGRPIANKRVYVVDEQLRPVPIGEDGELCIGGIGIGRYLNRPELMEERFALDPFAEHPGQLLYKTGDICRWLPDGTLEYVGRRDRQVKIRGQRVELDEVERVLEGAPGVAACLVREQDGKLEALVVTRGGDLDEPAVRDHLRAHLHSGMVPSSFVVVEELPRTTNGKADGRALVTPPSRTDEEERLSQLTWRMSQLFATSLDIPQVEIKADSDFFSVGGDSLAIAALLVKIEQETGAQLDVEALLEAPSPQGIASTILKLGGRT